MKMNSSSPPANHHRLSALSLAVLALLGSYANAQEATVSVVVTGQRASISKALSAQEKADHILSVISSDDIGGLPDKNAAEALARVPGISVQRDQGEGRYITVRGLGPDLNAVTINGALLPSPEAGRRAVALDVLPAGMIRSLEVSKTLTPEQAAGSLGGTVEVKTLSAFDLPGQLLSAYAGVSYDENIKKTSPNGGLLWAQRFMDGKLGVAAGLSAERREFGSDNLETGGSWIGGRLGGWELRDYLPVRERHALALNLDFRPNPDARYFVRTFLSDFSDDEVRDRLTISNISGGSLAESATASARGERRLRQRKYTQKIESVVLGSAQKFNDWTLEAAIDTGRASEDTPESINDARFRGSSNFAGISFTDTTLPRLSGPASMQDPASYSLNAITLQQRYSQDRETSAKLNLTYAFDLGGMASVLKFGTRLSRREKSNDTNQWTYNNKTAGTANYWGDGPTSMAAFASGATLDYPLGQIGIGIDPQLVRARVAGLARDPARLAVESKLNDFTMNENTDAFYVQDSIRADKWLVMGGVRAERSNFDAHGNKATGSVLSTIDRSRSYTNYLPSLHLRYDVDRHTSVRGAISRALVRANFSQLAPGVSLASSTEASIGNPDLEPLSSTGIDFGVEQLLGNDGAVSAYVFSKDIKNFTYTTNLAGTGAWAGYTTATSYANGDTAKVKGIELSWQKSLRMLPAPWNNLIVGANGTLTDSSAHIARYDSATKQVLGRNIRLPGQSDRMLNLMLGYENGALSGRLALNYKSPYVLELGADILNADQDRIVDTQKQLDFSVAYQINKRFQLVFDAANLNNEKYYVYQGNSKFNSQYEQYGRTYKISLRANAF